MYPSGTVYEGDMVDDKREVSIAVNGSLASFYEWHSYSYCGLNAWAIPRTTKFARFCPRRQEAGRHASRGPSAGDRCSRMSRSSS